jgi:hypothetical protein
MKYLLTLASALLLFVACGSDDNSTTPSGPSTDSEASRAVMIYMAAENNLTVIDIANNSGHRYLKEDLKEIGVPKIVFTFANSWTFGNLMGYEDFGSAFFRKNISEMTEEEREEKDPYYYLEKNRTELAARLSAYLIHGDSDMTIPLPSSVRLQRALAEVLGEEKVFFRIEPGMGHASDPLYATPILEEIDAFIRSSNGK